MKICSHTIVKNGMPFIGHILKQVEPYMDMQIITMSTKADPVTEKVVEEYADLYAKKVVLTYESVSAPAYLTQVRQQQIELTRDYDWALFLDDDDWWSHEAVEKTMEVIEARGSEKHAFSVNPYQLLGAREHDLSWRSRFFSKWMRMCPELHYERPWPRDLAFHGNAPLTSKLNPLTEMLPFKFFHLSFLKEHSFRTEDWATGKFPLSGGNPAPLPEEAWAEADKIMEVLKEWQITQA